MLENDIYSKTLRKSLGYVMVTGKSFLITGASGLIGSCIIDLLMLANQEGANNHVYALGRSYEKLSKRFSSFANNKYFHIIAQDVCSPLDDSYDFDYIVHGASNADPVSYAKYPVETMTTNILGGKNILDYGKLHQKCKITILSTFEVYGNGNKDVYSESDAGVLDFNQFRSCYPESKRSLEIMSRCYVDEYGVNVNVARLSSIYGPTMAANDSKAHAQFLRNALADKDIVLKSKGLPRRTYCYVVDAVTGILTVLFKGEKAESYNISNEKSTASIAEVAQIIAEVAGKDVVYDLPSEIEKKGFSKPQNCMLDNNKLRSLGWIGRYTLLEGIKETYRILRMKKYIEM